MLGWPICDPNGIAMSAPAPAPAPPPASSPAPENDPQSLVNALAHLLTVELIDTDLYLGRQQVGGQGRMFGGQVIAQALQAAQHTVGAKPAHSIHAYFIAPGDETAPLVLSISRDHDGRSFASRRVTASQHGRPILNMMASFQTNESGLEHQDGMPDVPGPEGLISEASYWAERADKLPERAKFHLLRPRPIEIRMVTHRSLFRPKKQEPRQASWFRTVAPLGDDPDLHRAILAYASDMSLLSTCTLPHEVSWMTGNLQSASLDHAVWFHDEFRADDWLLYVTDSPRAKGARGFNRGQIFTRDGRLIASTAQEGLIRVRPPKPAPDQ